MSVFNRTGRGTGATEADGGVTPSGEADRGPAQHITIGHRPSTAGSLGPEPTARRPRPRQAGADRRYAVLMLAEAATFGIASYLHLDGQIPLGFTTITGEHFSRASFPEAVIGAVLAAGAVAVAVAPGRARSAALGTTGFAVLGVMTGLGFVLTSSRPHIAIDLSYHLTILLVLLAGLVVLVRTSRRHPSGTASRAWAGSRPWNT